MITGLRLVNFKCHTNLVVPLSKLTLLSGFNAGGKSSAYQGLLLLSQAFKAGQRSSRVSVNGPLVRLGTASEAFSSRSLSKKSISIGVYVDGESFSWNLGPAENDETALCIESGLDSTDSTEYSSILATDAIENIVFISAIRGSSVEVFSSPEVINPAYGDVGPCGEFAAFWFNRLSDEDIGESRMHPKEKARTLRRQLSAWGSTLFPDFEATSSDLAGTGLIQLLMRNNIEDPYRRPSNLGYGLSYAFPILVACLTAKSSQTVIIDSPEAHLHPKAQSEMGRFLAAMAVGGPSVIVESHSDHILNGIRLAVKDKIIEHAKTSILFFDAKTSDDGATDFRPIFTLIDETGRLSKWPHGFFDQIEHDLSRL